MNITENDLKDAASAAGASPELASRLWAALKTQHARGDRPRFDTVNVAYYIGALIVIGAMGWFMDRAWDGMGGAGLFAVAGCYAVCFVLAGRTLWAEKHQIPGGLLFTIAVCMVPLATFGVERWTGYWPSGDPGSYANFHPYINSSWIIMECATIAAGLVALRFWRFPFLTAPIAYALWYMSMDVVSLIFRSAPDNWHGREQVSMYFGAAMLLATYLVDLRKGGEDYTFWGYLFGLMAFWGGLSCMDSNSEFSKFIYCLVNMGLIGCSLLLRRRAFIVFGGIGFFGYIGHLAHRFFEDSVLFPFVLSLLGISIIYLGLQYQKRKAGIESYIRTAILPSIGHWVPPRVLAE